MANFNTHLFVAASASSIAALTLVNKNLINLLDMPWFIFLGIIGGLLPDIDSDSSRPLRLFFTSLAILGAIFCIITYQDTYALQQVFILASSVFIIIRYPILALFKHCTVHRGSFHSLLCACLFTLITVCLSDYFFQNSILFSWLSGLFVGFGFIVHLLLDELYSVELNNVQLKRSFGTAFKIISFKYWGASILMFIICLLLYYFAPIFPASLYINTI